MLPAGTVIDNKYSIVSEIGGGGFGSVYRAVQIGFDRQVAIKILNSTLLQDQEGPARFEREARAMSAMQHKNIVRCYGFGAFQGAPYMVLELLEGTSLDRVLAKDRQIHPERALHIIRQVFEALQAAHAAGVVHRDLKPSNIMLVREPERPDREMVKVIDFGLARLMPGSGVTGQKLTDTGYTLGTCFYMPPEQALGAPVDQRADIYSTGCILYQMLAGRLPFTADDNVAVMHLHISQDPPPVQQFLAPGSAPYAVALSNFVQNCMGKNPDDRYQTASEALDELNRFDASSAKHLKVAPRAVSSGRRRPHAIGIATPGSSRSKRLVFPLTAVLILAVAALYGGANYLQHQHDQGLLESYRAQIAGFNVNPGLINPSTINQFSQLARADHQNPFLRNEERIMLNGHLACAWKDMVDRRQVNRELGVENTREFGHYLIPCASALNESAEERESARCSLMIATGEYLIAICDYDGAIALWKNLAESRNCRFNPRLRLSYLYMQLKNYDAAIETLKPILNDNEFAGGRFQAHLATGNASCLRGDLEQAQRYYREALDYPNSNGQQAAYTGQARVAYLKNDFETCLDLTELAQDEFRRASGTVTRRVGSAFLQGQRIPSKWGERYASALFLAAACQARLGHLETARQMIRRFDALDQNLHFDEGVVKQYDRCLAELAIEQAKMAKRNIGD